MMSEGKSISSDFLRLARISELMSQGFLCAHLGGLEQPWEPINPGCPCPRQGKTSSSDTELGWAGLSFPRLRLSLHCCKVLGCKSKLRAPWGFCSPVAQGCECGVFHILVCLSRRFLLLLRNAVGLRVNHPLHPQLRQLLASGSRTSLLGGLASLLSSP